MLIENLDFIEPTSFEIQGGSGKESYPHHPPYSPHPTYQGFPISPANVTVNVSNQILTVVQLASSVAVGIGNQKVLSFSSNKIAGLNAIN